MTPQEIEQWIKDEAEKYARERHRRRDGESMEANKYDQVIAVRAWAAGAKFLSKTLEEKEQEIERLQSELLEARLQGNSWD